MTRKMADAVNPNNIPVGVYPLVAGYINGPVSQWPPAGWARHAGHSILVRITVFASTNDGHVLDVEPGDATPAQAPGWVKMRRAAGADPTVYCSEAAWPAVRQAFVDAKVAQPHYWVAAYPGEGQVIPAGAIAHQWIDRGPLDESIVADYWPGVDQGDEMIDFTQPLPDPASVAGTNTVGEAFTVWLAGIAGKRNAGAGAAALANIEAGLQSATAQQSALLAAVQSGGVDPKAFAAVLAPVLAPLLPAGSSPQQVGDAIVAALVAHLAGTP